MTTMTAPPGFGLIGGARAARIRLATTEMGARYCDVAFFVERLGKALDENVSPERIALARASVSEAMIELGLAVTFLGELVKS